MNLPLLKIDNLDYKSIFIDTNNTYLYNIEDFFNEVTHKYTYKILDIFNTKKSKESQDALNLSSEYFKLSQEEKYLNFIIDIFKRNKYRCYVEVNINFESYEDYLYFSSKLDQIDKHLLLINFLRNYNRKGNVFLIDDSNLLKMFMKGMLREIFDSVLFFPESQMLIFSNFDLSLPIIIKNKGDENIYGEIARKYSLYLR